MDKVILGRLASFNLSMQQKKDLIEVIKYVAKYKVEYDNEEEIKRLIEFLNQYKIQEDGTFPDFDCKSDCKFNEGKILIRKI